MLCATDFHRAIVYLVLVVFNLSAGVYGAVATMVSILPKDDDDRATLCKHACGGVNELEGIELVVIDASDVHFACVCEDDSGVAA